VRPEGQEQSDAKLHYTNFIKGAIMRISNGKKKRFVHACAELGCAGWVPPWLVAK